MAEERITIPLDVPESFFDEMDRRFEAMARRASQQFSQAFKSGGPARGTAGGGGESPGGTAFSMAGGGAAGGSFGKGMSALAGAMPSTVGGFAAGLGIGAAASFITGAGAGIAATPAASASSPGVIGQNAVVGGATSLINGTIGQIPIVGDFVKAQMNSVKEAMELPTERGVARLKSIYGNLAASGIETTAEDREASIAFSQAIERKRYEGERQIEKQYREFAARDSLSYGLSWIGR